MNKARISITSVGFAVLFAACGSSGQGGGSGGSQNGGSGGSQNGGSGGSQNGGSGGSGNGGSGGSQSGGSGGSQNGGSGGSGNGGSGGSQSGGSGGSGNGGSGGSQNGGSGGTVKGGSGGSAGGGAGGSVVGGTTTTATGKGGATGGNTTGPGQTGGAQSTGGTTTNPGTGGSTTVASTLVTSASGNYWKSGTWTEVTSGTADVTVNDASASQNWEGFGGCFNEMGWNQLSTPALQTEAINLLFGADGANFALGRIPVGASDYAMSRYTLDDTGTDVTPDSSEGNRPAADTALASFKIDRDKEKLIPYIKAAMAVKSGLRFWASPWTPPVWMKTGYAKGNGSGGTVKKASYYDGGTMKTDDATLKAHAQYLIKFIQAYKGEGITIETIAPQNEPNYEQNYPSCLWASSNYASYVGKYLGPAIKDAGLSTKIMLGAMSNGDSSDKDQAVVAAVMADSTAKSYITVVGVQWSMMEKLSSYKSSLGSLPVWVSEHKCGNYPWNPSGYPAYVSAAAPNDQAYAVESWGYIRDAIKAGVTAYNAWNMVLDKVGKGIDTSRDWAQDSLLTVSGGAITKTPAYHVFRHFSQFAEPGGKVVGTSGSTEAIAFKNPDGSLVAVVYSKSAKSNYIIKIGGKMLQFSMPADGWATVKFKP